MFPTAIEIAARAASAGCQLSTAGPRATMKKRAKTTNAAAFVATAMNAVTGVGAPW